MGEAFAAGTIDGPGAFDFKQGVLVGRREGVKGGGRVYGGSLER